MGGVGERVGEQLTFTMASNMIRGIIAIFSMPMMQTPLELM
jgi:hypothetical protein